MFEFDDFEDMEQETEAVSSLSDGDIVILVESGGTVVARFRWLDENVYLWDHSLNWRELEDEAQVAILRDRNLWLSGSVYRCPENIGLKALWPSIQEPFADSA